MIARTAQPFELLGVGVATGFSSQRFAFFDKGLLERDAGELGGLNHFGPGNFQKSAIDRMSNGFLLYGAIDNDPLKLRWADRFRDDGGIDGRFEQCFYSGFADGFAKASHLSGITGKFGLVVVDLAAEVLPHDVLVLAASC